MIGFGNSMFLAIHGILARSASTPSFVGLLDTYSGAATAYSLRRLSTAYTGNLIRVRRSSDNTEQDFGYDANNVLDTASLLTFCGAGNGFVTTWYDQSGNANNATTGVAVSQPQIVSSGAMILINGKPSVQFDGSNDQLNLVTPFTADTSNYSSFVGKRAASGRSLFALAGADAVRYWLALHSDNIYYLLAKSGSYLQSSATDTTTNQLLITGQNNAGTMTMFKNGGTITTTNPGLTYTPLVNAIGKYAGSWTHSNIQETIFYNTNQSTNRTGIESNINTFYTIY